MREAEKTISKCCEYSMMFTSPATFSFILKRKIYIIFYNVCTNVHLFLFKFVSALEFSTIVASPCGHAPSNSTYALLKEGYTATYWWFYTRWFLIYFPLVFRPHVIPSCHLVAAPLASTSRCKGELLRLLHLCAITFSFPHAHIHTTHTRLLLQQVVTLGSISSVPLPFLYLFICLFSPLLPSSSSCAPVVLWSSRNFTLPLTATYSAR